MINDDINNVPEKTISIFIAPEVEDEDLTKKRILKLISPSTKKREWFTPHFYRCLPLTIGNQYGFTICSEFDFWFEWDGGDSSESTKLGFDEKIFKDKTFYPGIRTHFGHGIITINTPFFIRTPTGVNVMTMNPPNHVIPNITCMAGVVETDNLRRNFTFNLKIQMPNIRVFIPAGTPLAAFIPIPRYYADQFELKFADELFSKEIIDEEINSDKDSDKYRKNVELNLPNGVGKSYMMGKDVYGNVFKDHQRP